MAVMAGEPRPGVNVVPEGLDDLKLGRPEEVHVGMAGDAGGASADPCFLRHTCTWSDHQ